MGSPAVRTRNRRALELRFARAHLFRAQLRLCSRCTYGKYTLLLSYTGPETCRLDRLPLDLNAADCSCFYPGTPHCEVRRGHPLDERQPSMF